MKGSPHPSMTKQRTGLNRSRGRPGPSGLPCCLWDSPCALRECGVGRPEVHTQGSNSSNSHVAGESQRKWGRVFTSIVVKPPANEWQAFYLSPSWAGRQALGFESWTSSAMGDFRVVW